MTWQTSYRIRYSECDQQGVVFNAWYQTYMDDAVDCWLRELDNSFEDLGWEVMVKASRIVWPHLQSSAILSTSLLTFPGGEIRRWTCQWRVRWVIDMCSMAWSLMWPLVALTIPRSLSPQN